MPGVACLQQAASGDSRKDIGLYQPSYLKSLATWLLLDSSSAVLCSLTEQHASHPVWCISFNFVDLAHADVFASCSGVRVSDCAFGCMETVSYFVNALLQLSNT